jgi:hypothetical protein
MPPSGLTLSNANFQSCSPMTPVAVMALTAIGLCAAIPGRGLSHLPPQTNLQSPRRLASLVLRFDGGCFLLSVWADLCEAVISYLQISGSDWPSQWLPDLENGSGPNPMEGDQGLLFLVAGGTANQSGSDKEWRALVQLGAGLSFCLTWSIRLSICSPGKQPHPYRRHHHRVAVKRVTFEWHRN